MDSKLTLKLHSCAISMAKDYAKTRGTSLSQLVEAFFLSMCKQNETSQLSPEVQELSGMIHTQRMHPHGDLEHKKRYLQKKYLS